MSTINNCSRDSIIKTSNRKKKPSLKQKDGTKTVRPKITRERKHKREEPHEIFLKLRDYAIEEGDLTWGEMFTLASEDDFPKNMKYHGGQICFKYKNQNHELPLEEAEDIEVLYETVKKFYQQNIGIFSPNNIKEIKEKIEEYHSNLPKKDLKWNDIVKIDKIRTENLIKGYASRNADVEMEASLIIAVKTKMYCGKTSEGNFKIKDDILEEVEGIYLDELGIFRLLDCKIPKIPNFGTVNCDIDSASTTMEASKTVKKGNFFKYFERLSGVGAAASSDPRSEEKITTTKRQTKRQR